MSSCCAGKKQEASPPSYFLEKLKLYRPLLVILVLSVISACAVNITSANSYMNLLMGFFLLFLSALKLFNIEGFTTTFKRYDLLAKHIPFYGTVYPFIELVMSLYKIHFFSVIRRNSCGWYQSGCFPDNQK